MLTVCVAWRGLPRWLEKLEKEKTVAESNVAKKETLAKVAEEKVKIAVQESAKSHEEEKKAITALKKEVDEACGKCTAQRDALKKREHNVAKEKKAQAAANAVVDGAKSAAKAEHHSKKAAKKALQSASKDLKATSLAQAQDSSSDDSDSDSNWVLTIV